MTGGLRNNPQLHAGEQFWSSDDYATPNMFDPAVPLICRWCGASVVAIVPAVSLHNEWHEYLNAHKHPNLKRVPYRGA